MYTIVIHVIFEKVKFLLIQNFRTFANWYYKQPERLRRSKAKFFHTIKSTKFINSERVSENGGQYGLYCETRKNNVQQTGGGCLFVVTMNVYEQFAQVPNTQLFTRTFRLETRPREKQNFHTRLTDKFITIGIYYIYYTLGQ